MTVPKSSRPPTTVGTQSGMVFIPTMIGVTARNPSELVGAFANSHPKSGSRTSNRKPVLVVHRRQTTRAATERPTTRPRSVGDNLGSRPWQTQS